jgi:hypothetical protein
MGKADSDWAALQPQLDHWGFEADSFIQFADRLRRQQQARASEGGAASQSCMHASP